MLWVKPKVRGNARTVTPPTLTKLLAAIEPLETRRLMSTIPAGFTETLVASGFNNPTAMCLAPDGTIFVCDQNGGIRVVSSAGVLQATDLAFISGVSPFAERGLLNVICDPNYTTNHYIYIYDTQGSPNPHNELARLTVNATETGAVAGSLVTLFKLDDLNPNSLIHNSGALNFGPDGKLYVDVGDNASTTNAQSLNTDLGKILRLNLDGSIPTDNPFYNTLTGNNRAIFAYGFRNPFSGNIDPKTGEMLVGDVGEDSWEEIDQVVAGANYGWPITEGPTTAAGITGPLYTYHHGTSLYEGDAIDGGVFYDPANPTFPSQYVGKYLFSDYGGDWIDVLDPSAPASQTYSQTTHSPAVSNFASGLDYPVSLKVSPDGSLYYLQRGEVTSTRSTQGAVYRISYSATGVKPSVTDQPDAVTVGQGQTAAFTVAASGTAPLTYQWSKNGTPITGTNSNTYTTLANTSANNGDKYTVTITNSFGSVTSNAGVLTVLSNQPPVPKILTPTASTLVYGGETVNFSGTATDPEDGALPASAFTWQVDYYTDGLDRPLLPAFSGATSGSFQPPSITPYTRANVFFRVILTVQDSAGLTTTVTEDLQPQTSTLTLATAVINTDGSTTTAPAGVQVTLDGQPFNSPESELGVVGVQRAIGVSSPQTVNGVTYVFDHWSDSGLQTHNVSTPSANTTYTAFFKVQSSAPTVNGLAVTYYSNKDFTGTTTTATDTTLDHYWPTGTPGFGFDPETFSARWTGQVQAATTETYTITARADDGVRVWLGGNLIIDHFVDNSGMTDYSAKVSLVAGQKYDLRVDYYNNLGAGGMRLFWSTPTIAREIVPAADLFLPGTTATSVLTLAAGIVNADGSTSAAPAGVQVMLDGAAVNSPDVITSAVGVSHTISVASPQTVNGVTYVFDHWSDSGLQTHNVSTPSANTTYTAFFKVQSSAPTVNGLAVTYYSNKDFTGTTTTATDTTLDHYWPTGTPGFGFDPETFSARWTGQVQAATTETYTITARADDGVRVWLGGNLIIDHFVDNSGMTDYSAKVSLVAGQKYDLRVDYYNNLGAGGMRLFWSTPTIAREIVPAADLFLPASTPAVAAVTGESDQSIDSLALSIGSNYTYVPAK